MYNRKKVALSNIISKRLLHELDTYSQSIRNHEHVVFGANGALGFAITRALTSLNAPIIAITRKATPLLQTCNIHIIELDALNKEAVVSACKNATIIYHCINVAYKDWLKNMPIITDNILEGAKTAGARIVFPGNVYGYGPFESIPVTESHPRNAVSKKGKLRNQLEETIMAAHNEKTIEAVIPRFPDFFGINVTNELMGPLFNAPIKGHTAYWLGDGNTQHDLINIDDAAAACILLAINPNTYGKSWHVPGAGPVTGFEFIKMIFNESGKPPKMAVHGSCKLSFVGHYFGWFFPNAKEINELLYEFTDPLILDGNQFKSQFPDFSFTPHKVAIATTCEWFKKNPK